jgi:hypothetical protein
LDIGHLIVQLFGMAFVTATLHPALPTITHPFLCVIFYGCGGCHPQVVAEISDEMVNPVMLDTVKIIKQVKG